MFGLVAWFVFGFVFVLRINAVVGHPTTKVVIVDITAVGEDTRTAG